MVGGAADRTKKRRAKSLKKIFLWLKGRNIAESGLNFRRTIPLWAVRKPSGGLPWMQAKEDSAATCLEPLKWEFAEEGDPQKLKALL